jgi:hypothetical protein
MDFYSEVVSSTKVNVLLIMGTVSEVAGTFSATMSMKTL